MISCRSNDANTNLCVTANQALSQRAFAQLTQLMQATGDCDINWSNGNIAKYVISRYRDDIKSDTAYQTWSFLAFKSKSIRDEFLKKHKELIEAYYML